MVVNTITDYPSLHRELETRINGGVAPWVKPFRQAGLERFKSLGFPPANDEEWKYTNVKPIVQGPFKLSESSGPMDLSKYEAFRRGTEIEIVIIDGHFSPAHSDLTGLPAGIVVEPLETALAKGGHQIEGLLSTVSPVSEDGFTGLNRAFLHRGVFVAAAPGVKLETPIFITHVTTPEAIGRVFLPRTVISLGVKSDIRIVESHLSFDNPSVYFTNSVTDAFVPANAKFDYCKIHVEGEAAFHVGTTRIVAGAEAKVRSFNFSRGAGLCRHNLDITLNGENIDASLDGLYAVTGNAHVDNHTTVDHREPHSRSDQLYKGLLAGNGRAVFNGKIFVRPKAQLTNAYQLNRNLLLSRTAQVDTKPQLEIGADDVRCTHGATIGPVNAEEIFYLQARGIPKAKAIHMLSLGYAEDAIAKIGHVLIREKVETLLKPFFESCLEELSAMAIGREKK